MKSSDEIFRLIKSLTGKEKLFFRKKYLALITDADGNYLKLYDEISGQTERGNEYDEEKIKEGKYSGKFIKNFSFHKNYLYNSILSSLSILHKDSKDSFIIRNLITQAEILCGKLLYDQSNKLLQRAKINAEEKEIYTGMYEIINAERLIGKYTNSIETYIINSKELFDEQFRILGLQKNLLDYYMLNEKVGIFLRSFGSGWVRNENELLEFEEIFESPLLKKIENAKSFLAEYIFYNLNLQYQLVKKNYEEAYINSVSATRLCEKNLHKLKGKLDNYIFSLNNLLNCQIRTKRHSESEATAEKLKSLINKYSDTITESNKVFIFYSVSVLMLSEYIGTGSVEKLQALESEISTEYKLYEDKIQIYQRIILYYFLTCSGFARGDYEKCLYWNGKIFNLGKTDLSEDYQCYARIIQLISFYELGYFDSMEYALKSAYHFITKRKRVYKYENIIQKYLKKSFRINAEKEFIELIKEMKHDLEGIKNDEFEKNAFDAFNILAWLESKIRKVPVTEIIKSQKM